CRPRPPGPPGRGAASAWSQVVNPGGDHARLWREILPETAEQDDLGEAHALVGRGTQVAAGRGADLHGPVSRPSCQRLSSMLVIGSLAEREGDEDDGNRG